MVVVVGRGQGGAPKIPTLPWSAEGTMGGGLRYVWWVDTRSKYVESLTGEKFMEEGSEGGGGCGGMSTREGV